MNKRIVLRLFWDEFTATDVWSEFERWFCSEKKAKVIDCSQTSIWMKWKTSSCGHAQETSFHQRDNVQWVPCNATGQALLCNYQTIKVYWNFTTFCNNCRVLRCMPSLGERQMILNQTKPWREIATERLQMFPRGHITLWNFASQSTTSWLDHSLQPRSGKHGFRSVSDLGTMLQDLQHVLYQRRIIR